MSSTLFQITWYHGEAEVEESARSTIEDNGDWCYLKRKHMKASDAGVYRIKAQNAAGVDEASFNVTVQGLPSSPRNVRAAEVDKDYVILEWDEPEQDGGVEIVEHLVEKSLSGSSQ